MYDYRAFLNGDKKTVNDCEQVSVPHESKNEEEILI